MKNHLKIFLSRCRKRSAVLVHDAVPNPECSEFEVNNWLISDFVCRRLVPVVGIKPFPLNELSLMVGVVCRFRPKYIFEWGTNIGVSCRIFYETAKEFSIQTEIHSVDLPFDVDHIEHPKEQRGMLVKGLKGVHLHTGDGLSKSLELLRGKNLSSVERVLFFLDGDHEYGSVRRELETILTAHPDALILVHDTFNQSKGSGYNTGPYRAIADTLLGTSGRYHTLSQNLGLPGMTFIYKG